jgi:segregation and condensation protein B
MIIRQDRLFLAEGPGDDRHHHGDADDNHDEDGAVAGERRQRAARCVERGHRYGTGHVGHRPKHFIQNQTPPTRLSLAALETLAVIAYKQPVTIPEIQEIRGVQATGVIKTLLDKKLVATGGRKEVLGRPMLYATTREFLVHFGLKALDELPSMEEFEELIKSQATSGEESIQAELPLEDPQPEAREIEAGVEEPQLTAEAQEVEVRAEETPPVS